MSSYIHDLCLMYLYSVCRANGLLLSNKNPVTDLMDKKIKELEKENLNLKSNV